MLLNELMNVNEGKNNGGTRRLDRVFAQGRPILPTALKPRGTKDCFSFIEKISILLSMFCNVGRFFRR